MGVGSSGALNGLESLNETLSKIENKLSVVESAHVHLGGITDNVKLGIMIGISANG